MSTDRLHTITELTFQDEVLDSPVPVLVDFTAAWCPPCRALAPTLEAVAAETAGRAKVVAVSGDESPSLAAKYAVRGFPTVIVFVGGKEKGRQLGVTTKARLLRMIEPTG